ncbi:MAG: hypothetical protein ACO3F2_11745 [Roseiflexaceae bacterium]|jgi:hypothetical protein
MYLPVILLIRRIIGAILVIIGILGLLLPIMPGWPLLIPGIALLGSKDPLIRYLHMVVLKVLKFVKSRKTPWIRNLGERAYEAYRRTRDIVGPPILRFEHTLERWLKYTPKRPPEI